MSLGEYSWDVTVSLGEYFWDVCVAWRVLLGYENGTCLKFVVAPAVIPPHCATDQTVIQQCCVITQGALSMAETHVQCVPSVCGLGGKGSDNGTRRPPSQ